VAMRAAVYSMCSLYNLRLLSASLLSASAMLETLLNLSFRSLILADNSLALYLAASSRLL
jgi:hypothetical protein